MKGNLCFFACLGILASYQAQIRTSLYEEFSGENFGIWYPANPNLHITLQNNASAVIPITWAVPLPSAPSPSYSLYQSNKAEINWRYKSSSGSTLAAGPSTLGYGYPSQNTSSAIASNGINTGFTGRLDGQNTWVFGAASDDPADITSSVLLSAQSQTTNFRIVMSPSWSPTFTNCVVNVTLSSSTSFTALGDFYFRLCLVEREVHFPNPPGINGEKDFYDVVRRSYPTTVLNGSVTAMGTQVSGTWTPGQTQTLSLSCAIPSSIRDISLMDFVGFLQDDGDRKVYQAARTGPPAVPGDMRLSSILIPLACTNTFTPVFVAENLGSSAISGLTLSPYIEGLALPAYIYSATVVGNSSFQIALPSYTAAHGAHVFSLNISGVNGGDMNMVNNSKRVTFGIST
ncbi:MAG TPA: hypothetical protein PLQ93_10915, partial [Bacteroidia bacterium]|nr:hypothetical protein [Bacteroidia bacterium]